MEYTLTGMAAVPGVAIGPAFLYRPTHTTVTATRFAPTTDVPFSSSVEIERLDAAIAAVDALIAQSEAQLHREGKVEEAGIFTAHRLLLSDPELCERTRALIISENRYAVEAIAEVGDEQVAALLALDDPYLCARAADIRDVVAHVQRILTTESAFGENIAHPSIIIAQDLDPTALMSISREQLLGFALVKGNVTAHVVILARALEIPAVIGLNHTMLDTIPEGTNLVLDGYRGRIIVFPSDETIQQYRTDNALQTQRRTDLRTQPHLASVTRDGHTIFLKANVSSIAEAERARECGADGIGLLRTELLFLRHSDAPDEEEQAALYSAIAAVFPNQPIIVRTLDVGGDKTLPAFPLPPETNPFLGLRGIRIGLKRIELLLTQLRALLRAGATADIRILLPMVATIAEVRQVRFLLHQAQEQLYNAGLRYAVQPQLGIMVEIPAAALMAESLAGEVDFFSIGSNDLAQYTLACDRTNQQVANLYQPLEPAVLRLMAMTIIAAHQHQRPVTVCGEIAADPTMTALLLGLGVDELSCAPSALPFIRNAIRSVDMTTARALAHEALSATSLEEVQSLVYAAST